MKLLFWTVLVLAFLAYAGKTTLTFSPFKIHVAKPYELFGLLFLALAIGFLKYQSEVDGIKKGRDTTLQVLQEIIDEEDQ